MSGDILSRLRDSDLYGTENGPVCRGGTFLKGITASLWNRFGRGSRSEYSSDLKEGTAIHSEFSRAVNAGNSTLRGSWIVATLASRGIEPLASEVPIALGRWGTRIDAVCAVRGGRSMALSLKTGRRKKRFPASTGRLPKPFEYLPATTLSIAFLQLTLEMAISRRGHGVIFDDACVFVAPANELHPAPYWCGEEKTQDLLLESMGMLEKNIATSRILFYPPRTSVESSPRDEIREKERKEEELEPHERVPSVNVYGAN